MKLRHIAAVAAAGIALSMAACSSAGAPGSDDVTVNWWTWDPVQAEAYAQCVPDFEQDHPDVTVKISQYATPAYFTKLTAGFTGGNAPDAFMNSVQYFPTYITQHQLEPLDDHIADSGTDMSAFSIGTDAWTGADGTTYGLPMDWATSGIYYNEALVEDAGFADKDVQEMTFDPSDGGTVEELAAHLTVDENGVRGDEPGFDKTAVAVYGIGSLASNDFRGQTSWYPFAAATGWQKDSPTSWPTSFNYTDPRFVETMDWVTSMVDKGYSPRYGEFTVGGTEQLGSQKVAMIVGGSWEASTYAGLTKVKVGIAPSPLGPDGTTRGAFGNVNGNVVWAGGKHKEETWQWVSYQESEACQTKAAAYNGSFFPSDVRAMEALAKTAGEQGTDLSVFQSMLDKDQIAVSQPFNNGTEVQNLLQPLFESYFTGAEGDSVWAEAEESSRNALGEGS